MAFADQAVERLQQDAIERDRDLREGLRYEPAGGTRGRWIGAISLLLGIVLSVAGALTGTLV